MLATRNIELFQGIDDASLWSALEQLPVRRLPVGAVIFEQGSRASEVFILLSGKVEILLRRSQGGQHSLAALQEGALFGEFSFLTGMPRSSAAVASSEVSLLQIPGEWLGKLEAAHPQLRKRLVELYRQRVLTNVLHANRLFGSLSASEIADVVPLLQFKRFNPGAVLLSEGAQDFDLFVIKKGSVQVTKRQGKNVIALTELGPGEVVGEMAIVTGEARSASISALTALEVMLLPGEAVKRLLSKIPKLMQSLESLVSQRAAQTRKALEQLADEVMEAKPLDPADTQTQQALLMSVASLNLRFKAQSTQESQECQLSHLGLRRGRFFWSGKQALRNGEMLQLQFLPTKAKGLAALNSAGELTVVVQSIQESLIEVAIGEEHQAWISQLITVLAKAKVRLFVYPEYEVQSLALTAKLLPESNQNSFKVEKISQTNLYLAAPSPDALAIGQLYRLALHKQEKRLLQTSAVVLAHAEASLPLQFEYETAEEKNHLEGVLRQLAKELGYGKAAVAEVAPELASELHGAPTLIAAFKNRQEFVHAYTTGLEAGVLVVPATPKLTVGQAVKVRLVIADLSSLKLTSSGKVQALKGSVAHIELDSASSALRSKVEEICRELVESKNEASRLERRRQLAKSGVRLSWTPLQIGKHPAFVATLALVLLGLSWAYRYGQDNDPFNDGVNRRLHFKLGEQKIRLPLREVLMIRRTPGGKEFQLLGKNDNLQLPLEQKIRLTEFQRQQLEALLESQRKK